MDQGGAGRARMVEVAGAEDDARRLGRGCSAAGHGREGRVRARSRGEGEKQGAEKGNRAPLEWKSGAGSVREHGRRGFLPRMVAPWEGIEGERGIGSGRCRLLRVTALGGDGDRADALP